MLIKRRTLNEVGFFDEYTWNKGYGEENDFSLKAEKLGWKNVAATNVFIHHLGKTSFAENSEKFIQQNLTQLNRIYPDYPAKIQRFVKSDPLKKARRKLALKILESLNCKRSIMFISHTLRGGTELHVLDLIGRLEKEGILCPRLEAISESRWKIYFESFPYELQYDIHDEWEAFIEDLSFLKLDLIHFHHTLNFPKLVWSLPDELKIDYYVTIHDYYMVCPRSNFIDDTGRYCKEPDVEVCDKCMKQIGAHEASYLQLKDFDDRVTNWRSYFHQQLSGAARIITPSQDTSKRMSRYFPDLKFEAVYHPEKISKYSVKPIKKVNDRLSVAVIGAIGHHKGFDTLRSCIIDAYKRNLPIHFVITGYTAADEAIRSFPNTTITGEYQQKDLGRFLDFYECSLALFLSVCPETYSYTLSEALIHGVKPVVLDIGAPAERLKRLEVGYVLPLEYAPFEINDRLLSVAENEMDKVQRIDTNERTYKNVLMDYYQIGASS